MESGFVSLPPALSTKDWAYVEQDRPGGGLKYAVSWDEQRTGVLFRVAARTPPIPEPEMSIIV
jgi:hypothetical protein